jgi:hypothetical protein
MSTLHPQFTARVEGSPEFIFDLIADIPNYGRWLSGSDEFGGIRDVSPYPVCLGTTFLDAGPAGQWHCSVTGFDPPKYIAFHHTMRLKQGPVTASIDVHIQYTFEPVERATYVIRALDLTLQVPGLLKVAESLIMWAFRKENERILAELKRYVEAQPKQRQIRTIGSPEAP